MRCLLFRLVNSCFLLVVMGGCSQNPATWLRSVNAKARNISFLDARYEALEAEHLRLKREFFRIENEYLELRAKEESRETSEFNLKATGTLSGRAPSSIAYQVPKGLQPEETLALAYEHFTEQRFAEAAITFENFLNRPESAALADATAMYTAGVSWFKLGNYKKARNQFEAARKNAGGEQREKIHKKVDLWMRAIERSGPQGG